MTAAMVDQLIALLGNDRVSIDPSDLEEHARDWSSRALLATRGREASSPPLAVVRPHDSAEVARLLEWAGETNTPVLPIGGGSSVVRGIHGAGHVVVDLRHLDGISEVDTKSRLVTVGAGVTGPHLRTALQKSGFLLFVTCHVSHIYRDGACLYFTLGKSCDDDATAVASNEKWWDVGMTACLKAGGTIRHHHGIGRQRARWLPDEVGDSFEVLRAIKAALDPQGILNPGALGLAQR